MKLSNKIFVALISATVFLTPLIVWDGLLFASTVSKTFFFATIVELMLVFWLPSALSLYKARGRSVVSLFVVLFFVVASVASMLGADFSRSYWSNYERMFGLWTLGHIVIFFFIMATTLVRREDWIWPMRAAVVGAAISALVAIFEFVSSGGARVESTMRNASFLASYLLLASFLSLWLCVRSGARRIESALFGACWLVIITALVLTGSRGAMLALGAGIVLLAILFLALAKGSEKTLGIQNKTLKRYCIALLVLAAITFGTGVALRERLAASSFDPLSRLASISISESTASGRLLAWQVTWRGWKERPLLGWGWENYHILFDRNYDPRLVDQEPWFDRAHNIFLDVGSTTGILGLAAYLGMFFSAIYLLARGWKNGAIGFWEFAIFSVALLAHLMQGMFMFDFLMSLVLLFLIFAFAHSHKYFSEKPIKSMAQGKLSIYLFIAAIIILPIWFFGVLQPFRENRLARMGYDAFAAGRDDEAIELFEKALSYDTYGNIDARRSVAEYIFDFLKSGGRRSQQSLARVMNFGIEKMEQNIQEATQDVKWYMYQGELYNLAATILGDTNIEYARRAEERFMQAKKLSSGRPQIYLEIAQGRKVQGNIVGMWESVDEGLRIAPKLKLLHNIALIFAIETGEGGREKIEYEYIFSDESLPDYRNITEAYYKVQRFSEAARVHKLFIDRKEKTLHILFSDEERAQIYKDLAILEAKAGNREAAREAALRYGKVFPNQQKEVEAFIKSLGF